MINIKISGERFRVDYEGGTYCPGDRFTPPDEEPFNVIQIEWFKNDRFVDVTGLLEADLIDHDDIVEKIKETFEPYD